MPRLLHTRRSAGRGLLAAMLVAAAATVAPVAATAQQARAATGCGDLGDTSPVNEAFPDRMSSLLGADIRTGAHECFERVVVEFTGEGELPGYWVRYEPDPIVDSPSGEPVDIAGAATLVVSVGAWMTGPEGGGYDGPREFTPDNVVHIVELQLIEDFEGQSAWAIGLDATRDFTVSTLADPPHIVIDIAADTPAEPSPGPGDGLPPTR